MEDKEQGVYKVDEVAKICGCSKAKAYNIIRALNNELIKNGAPKLSVVSGRVSKKFFHETLKI